MCFSRPPGYLGIIPTRPISQEPQFVYLFVTNQAKTVLKNSSQGTGGAQPFPWSPVVPGAEAADYCHGSLVLSPAPHFPWLSLKEHLFPCSLPALSTTFVIREKQSDLLGFFLRWIVCPGREVDLTWILDLKPVLDTSPATSWNILEIL